MYLELIQEDHVMIQILNELNSFIDAIKYSLRCGNKSDKALYLEIGIEPSHWSRMMHGSAHFPAEKLVQFMNIVGNDIPLQWLALKRGYKLKVAKETLEQQLERQKEENRLLQNKLSAIIETLKQAGMSNI